MKYLPRTLAAITVALAAAAASACGSGDSKTAQQSSNVTPAAARPAEPGLQQLPTAVTLKGGGAGFQQPMITAWTDAYHLSLDQNLGLTYESIGSGDGMAKFTKSELDIAPVDRVMTDAQLQAAPGTLHIPSAVRAIVVSYNLPGVSSGLKFSGELLSDLFMGKIRKWNDPRIQELNPEVNLPAMDITIVHSEESSSGTNLFTTYLSAVSPEWKEKIGAGSLVNWPTGNPRVGNAGLTLGVRETPGALGYVDMLQAFQAKLTIASIKNKAGNFIKPSPEAVAAAAAGVATSAPDHLRVAIVNADGGDSYPISSFVWFLVRDKQSDPNKAQAITGLLWWSLHDDLAKKIQADLGYSAVPAPMVAKADKLIESITVDGKPALSLKK